MKRFFAFCFVNALVIIFAVTRVGLSKRRQTVLQQKEDERARRFEQFCDAMAARNIQIRDDGIEHTLRIVKKSEYTRVYDIAMATDHRLINQIQVSIVSALLNAEHDVLLNYHILVSQSLSTEDKAKIKELEHRFDNCRINFLVMGDEYEKLDTGNGRLSSATYYRLSLPSILPNVDKIFWLDCDTLVRKDLSPIFAIDMEDLYFLGVQDYRWFKVFGHPNDRYICAGVLLMNLKKMRQDNLEQKLKDFLVLHDKDADKQDQTAINSVGYDGIRFLPPKYAIFCFPLKGGIDEYLDSNKNGNYTRQELEEAIKDPIVVHITRKPWRKPGLRFAREWWSYAKILGQQQYEQLKETLANNMKHSTFFFHWLLMKLGIYELQFE